MLIKVFPKGTGRGYGPVEYAISPNPFGKGQRQTSPIVKKGDPQQMIHQIDAVPFKWKYTSGAICFAKEDNPSDEQINYLIEDFEQLAFAGLPLSSRSILWVQHEENGRKELHFILPRQEVHTGKSFNAFPPGWEKKFDLIRDKYNYSYGWARPDDPVRARNWQPRHFALIKADSERNQLSAPPCMAETLTEHISALVIKGKLQTRADIVQELLTLGYQLPRQGKEYLTILDSDTGKRTRLKGTLFHTDFNGSTWLQKHIFQLPDKKPNLEKAQEAEQALGNAVTNATIYNQQRYNLKEAYYEPKQSKSKPEATRAGEHSNPRKALPTQKRSDDSGDRIPTSSEGIQGIELGEYGIKQGIRFTDTIGGKLLFSSKNATITRKGNKTVASTVGQCHHSPPSFHSLGGQSGEGYDVETVDRSSLAEVHGGTDKPVAIDGDQVGRATQWQSRVTGRNAQSRHGNPERSAYQAGESGSILVVQAACKTQVNRIIDKWCLVNEMRLLQALAEPLMPLHVPSLLTINRSTVRIMEHLPHIVDLNLSKQLALHMAKLATPICRAELAEFALSIKAELLLAHEQCLLQSMADNYGLLNPPIFTPLQQTVNTIMAKLDQVHEMRLLQILSQHLMPLYVPNIADLNHNSARIMEYLPQIADLTLSRQLVRSMEKITTPDLSKLETRVRSVEAKIPLAYEHRSLQSIASNLALLNPPEITLLKRVAENIMSKVTQANDEKTIKKIYQAERYRRTEQIFWQYAHWAGHNLLRWRQVRRKTRKDILLHKMYRHYTSQAHRWFMSMTEDIGSDSVAWKKVYEQCQSNPFLIKELALRIQQQQKDRLRETKIRQQIEPAPNKHITQTSDKEDEADLQESTALRLTVSP